MDSPLKRWTPIANSLSDPSIKILRLDPKNAGAKEIQVRVTAYNGFAESVTTKSIKIQ